MASYSKMLTDGFLIPIFQASTKTHLRKFITLVVIAAITYGIRKRSMREAGANINGEEGGKDAKKKKSKGTVDKLFLKRCLRLARISIP